MKIVHILDSFFPDSRAGTEQYVLWLANFMQDAGHDVSIIAASITITGSYTYEGIQVYRFLVPNDPISRELNGLIPPRGIENFEKLLIKLSPDIAHFHSFSRAINGYHLELAKKLEIKTVFTAHLGNLFCIKGDFLLFGKEICDGKVLQSRCMQCFLSSKQGSGNTLKIKLSAGFINRVVNSPFHKLFPSAWHLVKHRQEELKRLKLYGDAVIAIAPWIERVFQLNHIENVWLVKQGIQFQENQEPSTKNQDKRLDKPIKLIFVGRLHPMKGLHLLLDALDSFSLGKFLLIVIGISHDEDYKIEMRAKALQLGVEWHENKMHDEVLDLISKSDILVLPAISNEMAPLVILEAFACGKPVIGSTYPAIGDMVTDGFNGLLFENKNVKSLTYCLQRLLDAPNLLPCLKSNMQPPRSFEDVAEDMMGIYKQIVRQ